MMQKKLVDEGYMLMMKYITDNRIKTKNRNFVRRLNNFYSKLTDTISTDEELKFLKFEQEFFKDICPPSSNEDKAQLEVLNIMILQKENNI